VLLTGGCSAIGCSSAESTTADGDCTKSTSSALKTCAGPTTLTGIDVSYYQGNVGWAAVKSSGRAFAFARVSDGLNYPDTKFAQNWPAMKTAGITRGVYQFFRPSQDANAQAQLLIDKLTANGGLKPGDLPPVLDLESADGLASATVVAKAKTWLAKVEAKYGVKPIVYTAAFMTPVIGNNFTAYPLWVANYQTTCPTMPGAWTKWKFWQNSDSGSVPGVSGNVDTNFFDGNATLLGALTLQPAPADPGPGGGQAPTIVPEDIDLTPSDDKPNDGSQGSTIGSGDRPPAETNAGVITPCR
jgi:lysozyme